MRILSYLLWAGLTCISFFALGQRTKSADEVFWGADDPAKNIQKVPEKWQGESAVMLYQSYEFIYHNQGRSVDYVERLRKRIALLDRSAVEEFSEFSYAEKFKVRKGSYGKSGKVLAGFKVIKPDGSETRIDMDDVVQLESDKSVKKVAIPGLEPGDIIDFYYYAYEPFIALAEYKFEPVVTTLAGDYPIAEQRISFVVERDFYVNFNTYNNAPKLAVQDEGKKTITYALIDRDRDKVEQLRWFFPRRVLPTVKFQVVFARKGKLVESADAFLGEDGQVKTEVTAEEVRTFYEPRLSFNRDIKSMLRYLSQQELLNSGKEEEMMAAAYYYARYSLIVSQLEPILFLQQEYITYLSSYTYGNFPDDEDVVEVFGSFLKSQGIPFDVVVAEPKFLGTLDQLLIQDEVDLMIKIRDKPIYVSQFGLHTNFGSIPQSLEGTEAYLLELDNREKVAGVSRVEIPSSTHLDNTHKQTIRVSIGENIDKMFVERTVSQTGYSKLSTQSNLTQYYDYLREDYELFRITDYIHRAGINRKRKPDVRKQYAEKQAKDREEQKDDFKEQVEDELNIEVAEYEDFQIISLGRHEDDLGFSYTETFELGNDLIKRVGPNYLLEVGKIIGGQVGLKKEELTRDWDIHMPYARSFDYEISINIPEGYTVEGVDKLTFSVDNNAGGFISKAEISNGQLLIQTSKFYRHAYEPAASWPLMVEFLEAAYDFTQAKVLLKKG